MKRALPLLMSPVTKNHANSENTKISPFENLSIMHVNGIWDSVVLRWPESHCPSESAECTLHNYIPFQCFLLMRIMWVRGQVGAKFSQDSCSSHEHLLDVLPGPMPNSWAPPGCPRVCFQTRTIFVLSIPSSLLHTHETFLFHVKHLHLLVCI